MPRPTDILQVMARHADPRERDLTTPALARAAGWSPAHFHRDFQRVTGETPKRWTQRLRLARTIECLGTTDRPIAEVARTCGWSSHAQLSRAMRRCLDTTPSAVRAAGPQPHVRHALCLTLYHLSLEPRKAPMSHTVEITERPAQPVVFQRRTVPMDQLQGALAACLPAVFVHCQQHGLTMAGPPFTRYIAMTPGSATIEAGIPVVEAKGSDEADILAGELPAGPAATTIHQGPYDTLRAAYSALEAFVLEGGHTPAGAPWESYLTDPGEVPDPADWKTQVCMPLG